MTCALGLMITCKDDDANGYTCGHCIISKEITALDSNHMVSHLEVDS